jgi:hypothetical protein
MANSLALYCASSLGVMDLVCSITTSVPLARDSASRYADYFEIFGYFLFVFSLFCLYFLVLFSYKVMKGYSLPYSFRFALCGVQRVLYNRTIRLGASLFTSPAPASASDASVLPMPIYRVCNPVNVSTPLSAVVIEMTPSPIYSVPGETSTESTLGVIVGD